MPFALITRLLTGEAGIYFARLRRVATWYAIAGAMGLVTAIFLVVALFLWIASGIGPIGAALVVAGAFLVFALLAFFVAQMVGRPPRTQREDRLQRDIASIAGVTALANLPQLGRLVRRKRGLVVIPAAAAGFFGLYKLVAALRDR